MTNEQSTIASNEQSASVSNETSTSTREDFLAEEPAVGEEAAGSSPDEAPSPTLEAPSPTLEAPSPTLEAPSPTLEAPSPTLEAAASLVLRETALPESIVLPEPLATLLALAQQLAQAGGLSRHATEAQKWQAGDLVQAMQRFVEACRDRLLDPFTPATPEAKADFQRCCRACDAFLGGQERTRGSLVDAALVAATFSPGHPVRHGPLSFSHARTLSRLPTERERAEWAARAEREGLSVARLWSLILTEGAAGTEGWNEAEAQNEAGEGRAAVFPASSLPASSLPASSLPASSLPASSLPASSLPASSLPAERLANESAAFVALVRSQGHRRHHAHVCAFTGREIDDLAAMAEVRVHLDEAGAAALFPSRLRVRPRGGAARRRAGGVVGSFPVLLRFADLAAVQDWLAARERLQASEDASEGEGAAPGDGPFL